MVNCHQFVLDVGSCTHLLRTAKKHSHLPGTNLGKEVFFLCLGICIMDKGNFFRRHTVCNQLGFDIIIDIEGSIIFRCAKVAEHQLGQFVSLTVLPDTQDISHAGIELAVRVIG